MRSGRLAGGALLALLVLMGAEPASAKVYRDLASVPLASIEQSMGQSGPEFKALYNTYDQFGMLVGGRGVGYMSHSFYLGGAGYGGTLTRLGLTEQTMGYGGVVAGFERQIWPGWGFDMNLLVGAGAAGSVDADTRISMVLEPRASLSCYFGGGVRTALSGGYLYAPNALGFSGPTVGLRVEFKTLTLHVPVDD